MKMKIKFKGKVINSEHYPEMNGKWFYGYYTQDLSGAQMKHYIYNCPTHFEVDPKTVGQYIDTIDNQEIYVGDIIRHRKIYRAYEDHGTCREPMEVRIKTMEHEVAYDDGFFGVLNDNTYDDLPVTPLSWVSGKHALEDLIEVFNSDRGMFDNMDDKELKEEIGYLCEEYGLADLDELIAYSNVFLVVGNIHNEEI